MRRFLAGVAFTLVVVVAPVALAAGGDTTIKGNLTVGGAATVAGDTFTRSVQAQSGTISNFTDVGVSDSLVSPHLAIVAGGSGIGWQDQSRTDQTRIIAGEYADPTTVPAPPSSLLLRRNPAQLWFRTDAGWTCVAGC